jgi:valyl-tRNA synthetase
MTEIPKQYDPQAAQAHWFSFWEQHGYFNANPGTGKPPHTIMIPLPNVTGALHMGHALNGTLQDLVTRWRRMQGYEALWMPGTDHAGIATQAVVERRMYEEEGLTRHDVGREALVNRIWHWKEVYEKRIVEQQKTLGASCDWRRIRFTLDEVCARAVRQTFFNMFRDGLIYRGKRLVNWDVYLQTAVADDEVFEEEIAGHFWTFNYPVVDAAGNDTDERIRFSTTRPETMLGDTAVCVHPLDQRFAHLVGKRVRIPLNNRLIPIITDEKLANMEKGTGAVKVTPAHDPNDYACYERNRHIGIINILNPDGTLNEQGGPWQGRDRLEARPLIIDKMAELGFFEGVEDRVIPLKHSDRSKTPIEPYLSDQWFVKMGPHTTPSGRQVDLAQSAMDAVNEGRVRFYPSRYASTYLDWLKEKRDWCISRQLWWGHRIPIWSCLESPESLRLLQSFGMELVEGKFQHRPELRHAVHTEVTLPNAEGQSLLLVCVNEGHPDIEAQLEEAGFQQDPDVLDTWFSSALWPHATLGWPDRDHNPPLNAAELARQSACTDPAGTETPGENSVLKTFYPHAEPADGNHSVLITSRDIITLWVARMVLTGLYNMGEIPFRHVHVHPKILDGFGQTMSKSKGNGVDPVDLINKYGADAVRFTIASFAGETQDVRLPISYECPQCETLIPAKLYKLETSSVVVPSTLKGSFPVPQGQPRPTLLCTNPKCKAESQFSTPLYDPDGQLPVAKMVSERFEYGRNFCNKFWNAARFAMLNLEGYTPGEVTTEQLQLEDRWILSRLSTVAQQMNECLSRYQFDVATRAVRDFTWNEFCDWYLEMIKPRLRKPAEGEPGPERVIAQRVLLAVLDSLLRLLQPFTPYICEELWQRLREIAPVRSLPADSGAPLQPCSVDAAAIVAHWPKLPASWQDHALEKKFARLQETIVAIRNVRAIYNLPPGAPVKLLMRTTPEIAGEMQSIAPQFDNLTKAVLEAVGADVERPAGSASFTLGDADGFIPLEGLVDRKAELVRQQKEAEKLRKHIAGHSAKLNNESFTSKAPADVVAQVRETLEGLQKQLASVEEIIRDLS